MLDAAVGTSFSLDLEALLTAPIAFALFDAHDEEERPDLEPVGLLEAIRRHSDRITLFCQAGQIAVPPKHRTVFAWLESGVVPVEAKHKAMLFHPKVWVVRYRTQEEGFVLRVLCATRNLTFDTSWDTLLQVETEPFPPVGSRKDANGAPLATLLRALPGLATVTPGRERVDQLESLADDLERVTFVPPHPFQSVDFHVLGLGRRHRLLPTGQRAVAISPFLGPDAVTDLANSNSVELLVSREESLDRLPPGAVEGIDRVATLSPAVDIDSDRGESAPLGAGEEVDPARLFSGLHAKLYVFQGYRTSVFTGSANLTTAGFGGNVEVLAELQGPKKAGIDALLSSTPGESRFVDLLVDWTPPSKPVESDADDELDLAFGAARRALAGLDYHATITATDDSYALHLRSADVVPEIGIDDAEISMRPVTLPQATGRMSSGDPVDVTFSVSLEGITSFFAVDIAVGGSSDFSTRFLVNASLDGVPEDRYARLLASMLRDTDRLLRYLLLLLADEANLAAGALDGAAAPWMDRWGGSSWTEIPLLELLVRAVDRFPDRLDHIERLLTDLGDDREAILPEGFGELWAPIRAATGSRKP